MIFLANENFPMPSVEILRKRSFEIVCITEKFSGISDLQVLEMARDKKYVILTFDKDYGELIFKYKFVNPPAVIFFRSKGASPVYAANALLEILDFKKISLENLFTVIESGSVRQRKL
jgi:predicted nuclease of predicted toxin-antitoxin system